MLHPEIAVLMSVVIFFVNKKAGALLATLGAMHFAGFDYANIAFIVTLVAIFCWISVRVMRLSDL